MKKLAFGDVAPTFTVRDTYEQKIVVSPGKQNSTLIAFLRFSACPFCNLAINRLVREYEALKSRGVDVIAFVESDNKHIQQHIIEAHDGHMPFPIIPRQHPNVYALYGVGPKFDVGMALSSVPLWAKKILKYGIKSIDVDGNVMQAQALFLVSPSGNVLLAKYATNIYDPAVFTEVYAAADRAVHL